jgi:hypothetical protein
MKKMKRVIVIAVAVALTAWTSGAAEIQTKRDPVLQTLTTATIGNVVPAKPGVGEITVGPGKTVLSSGETFYIIGVEYIGPKWIGLNGEVAVNIDDEVNLWKGEFPERKLMGEDRVWEYVSIFTNRAQLKKIANGRKVLMELYPDQAPTIVLTFTPENKAAFRNFLEATN